MADEVEMGDECDDEAASLSRGRGAIGIATSPIRLYAGYPSHCLPDLTHLVHCGRVSSHFTLRFLRGLVSKCTRTRTRYWVMAVKFAYLQLLHPVFTFGRLCLLALTVLVASSPPGIVTSSTVRIYHPTRADPSALVLDELTNLIDDKLLIPALL